MDKACHIDPFNKDHAIEEIVFLIRFASEIPEDILRKIVALKDTKEIRETFPRYQEKIGQTIIASFEQGKSKDVQQPKAKLAGVSYQRFKPNGTPERILSADLDRFEYHCFDYSRWAQIWPEARKYLETIALYANELPVRLIGLHVRDRFSIAGNPKNFDPSELFRVDSPFLTPNIFNIRDLWHCHHGFFEDSDHDRVDKKLFVTNVSTVIADNDKLNARIDCFFEARFDRPGLNTQQLFGEGSGLIDELMLDLHNKNKSILHQIINEDMAHRISLEVS